MVGGMALQTEGRSYGQEGWSYGRRDSATHGGTEIRAEGWSYGRRDEDTDKRVKATDGGTEIRTVELELRTGERFYGRNTGRTN